MEVEDVVIITDGNKLTIQSAAYIEHGWYIEVSGRNIKLYEIPLGGGEEQLVGDFKTLKEAFEHKNTLT